jgi:hypothetical protein
MNARDSKTKILQKNLKKNEFPNLHVLAGFEPPTISKILHFLQLLIIKFQYQEIFNYK